MVEKGGCCACNAAVGWCCRCWCRCTGERGATRSWKRGGYCWRRMQRDTGDAGECLDTDTAWPLSVPSSGFSLSISTVLPPSPYSGHVSFSLLLWFTVSYHFSTNCHSVASFSLLLSLIFFSVTLSASMLPVSVVPVRRHNIDNCYRERSSRIRSHRLLYRVIFANRAASRSTPELRV